MIKLNSKGLTAVEVIISFTITAVIVVSLFKVINNFKEKQYLESSKNQIETFKNTVTKTIQDDVLVNEGLASIENLEDITDKYDYNYSNGQLKVVFNFVNGSTGSLLINIRNEGNANREEYLLYTSSSGNKEKFSLEDIPDVEFNEQKFDYDADNGLLNIYVGIYHVDLGDKYSVLDITLPLTEKWPNAYKH